MYSPNITLTILNTVFQVYTYSICTVFIQYMYNLTSKLVLMSIFLLTLFVIAFKTVTNDRYPYQCFLICHLYGLDLVRFGHKNNLIMSEGPWSLLKYTNTDSWKKKWTMSFSAKSQFSVSCCWHCICERTLIICMQEDASHISTNGKCGGFLTLCSTNGNQQHTTLTSLRSYPECCGTTPEISDKRNQGLFKIWT